MKNNKYIYAIIVLVIILVAGYFLSNNKKLTTETISDVATKPAITTIKSEQDLKNPTDKTAYPVGSYKVFIEQYGKVGSSIPPKIKVYNANTGSDLNPVEDYVFYKFWGVKKSEDAIAVYCLPMAQYDPTEVKSASDSEIHMPPVSSSLDMYLDHDTNYLSFVCVPK